MKFETWRTSTVSLSEETLGQGNGFPTLATIGNVKSDIVLYFSAEPHSEKIRDPSLKGSKALPKSEI